MIAADDDRKLTATQRMLDFIGQVPAQPGNSPRRAATIPGRCKQRPPPIEPWMMRKLVPSLRAMKGNRPVLAGLVLRPKAASRTDDPNAGVFL